MVGIHHILKIGGYGGYPKMGNMVGIHCMVKKLVIWWISTTLKNGKYGGYPPHCQKFVIWWVSAVYSNWQDSGYPLPGKKISNMVGLHRIFKNRKYGICCLFKIGEMVGIHHIVKSLWYGGYPPFTQDWQDGWYPLHSKKVGDLVGIHRISKIWQYGRYPPFI